MKPTIKIYPRIDLKKADERYPIYLRLTINRKRKYFSLNIAVPKPEIYWNPETRQIKRYPGANPVDIARENIEIESYYNKASGIIHRSIVSGQPLTIDEFVRQFKLQDEIKDSFYAFASQEVAFLIQKKASGETIRGYNSYISKLKKYRPTLSFSDITLNFIKEYHAYMINDLGNMVNTCHKSLSFMRTILNRAIDQGIIQSNVFDKYPLTKVPGTRDFLTMDELQELDKLFHAGSLKKYQANVLRYFLFSCYTGLRYQDVKDLKYKDLKHENNNGEKGMFVRLSMHKTKDLVSIPVTQKARELIGDGFENQRVFRANSNQVTNRYLKEIAIEAEINKRITFHCARHTFATASISLGIPIEVVSKLLGHKDLKTTMIYSKIVDDLKIHYMKRWDEI